MTGDSLQAKQPFIIHRISRKPVMKQKISTPVAVAILVVIVVVVFGALYKKYMYQQTYTVDDIAAKYRAASAKMHAPPNMQPQQNGNRQP